MFNSSNTYLGSHMWEDRNFVVIAQSRVDVWLVGEDIEAG
jgi:hypothetical protein